VLPIVALVGRPNVGKSTLFNTLTRTRDAIVADVPGVTRDRQYGYGQFGSNAYVVIDTGGLVVENPSVIEAQMRMQTERAVAEADRLVPSSWPSTRSRAWIRRSP
jgi:GTP-binding protein